MSYRLSNTPIRESRLVKEVRQPKSKVLFFTEGIKTEIIYLKELKNHVKEDKNVQIEIFDRLKNLTGESNQLKVVQRAKEYLETCQKLGQKKRTLIEKTIEKLEFGEWSINDIREITQTLESKIDDEILSVEDQLEAQLQSIKTCYDFDPEYDKVCFVLDRDLKSFKEYQFDTVIEICEKEGFELGISTPNFEFYLLLHFMDSFEGKSNNDVLQNVNNFTETTLKRIFKDRFGENYKKNNYNAKIFFENFGYFRQNVQAYHQDNLKLKCNIGTSLGTIIEKLIR